MQEGMSSSLEILLKSVEYMELGSVNGFETSVKPGPNEPGPSNASPANAGSPEGDGRTEGGKGISSLDIKEREDEPAQQQAAEPTVKPSNQDFNHGVGEAFANLANLSISECDDLEHLGMGSFSKLTELYIYRCGFKYLFFPSSARRLVQLRKLKIDNCPMMEEIIRPREQEEEEIIEFPNLKQMYLTDLPRFKSFFYCKNTSTFPVHSLFNGMVSFPRLEDLRVMNRSEHGYDFFEVMGLNANLPGDHGIHHLLCFRGLKTLAVWGCNGLSTLFTCSLAKTNLQQLEHLFVRSCRTMEEIVRDENEEGNNKKMVATDGTNAHAAAHEILFPRLRTIYLWDLRVLKSFCGSARYTFHMPSLERVRLFYLPTINHAPQVQTILSWE